MSVIQQVYLAEAGYSIYIKELNQIRIMNVLVRLL
jgi:hypothetical protein